MLVKDSLSILVFKLKPFMKRGSTRLSESNLRIGRILTMEKILKTIQNQIGTRCVNESIWFKYLACGWPKGLSHDPSSWHIEEIIEINYIMRQQVIFQDYKEDESIEMKRKRFKVSIETESYLSFEPDDSFVDDTLLVDQ